MEARSQLQQRGDLPRGGDVAGAGPDDAGDELEDGALAGAVLPHETEDLSLMHREVHVLDGPELLVPAIPRRTKSTNSSWNVSLRSWWIT